MFLYVNPLSGSTVTLTNSPVKSFASGSKKIILKGCYSIMYGKLVIIQNLTGNVSYSFHVGTMH